MVPLEQDEHIIREVRKHWILLAGQIFFNILVALVPFACILFIKYFGNSPAADTLVSYIIILSPIWILALWVSLFYFWTEYYLDVLIVTNKRILDIDQKNLFDREVSTFPLENIQDIIIHTEGVVATLLHFGDIEVQTAGEHESFTITNAKDPELVKTILTDAHDAALERLRTKNPL